MTGVEDARPGGIFPLTTRGLAERILRRLRAQTTADHRRTLGRPG